MKPMIIAIDGPAGAGKSTIARRVAKKLGILYVDTGAMYRAVAWKALQEKINFKDTKALIQSAKKNKIQLKQNPRENRIQVFSNGKKITFAIRTETVSHYTSQVAVLPEIRKILQQAQRKMGQSQSIVMEGRDIGTAVFPKAQFKFYLDASPLERAKRRYKELKARGKVMSLRSLTRAITQRDYRDQHRKDSPLRCAKDAIRIDTTHLTLPQVVTRILTRIES
jgi:cytidylate kinase